MVAAAVRHAPVVAVSGLMTFFGLWGLARGSAMGNDEVVSRYAALLSIGQVLLRAFMRLWRTDHES